MSDQKPSASDVLSWLQRGVPIKVRSDHDGSCAQCTATLQLVESGQVALDDTGHARLESA